MRRTPKASETNSGGRRPGPDPAFTLRLSALAISEIGLEDAPPEANGVGRGRRARFGWWRGLWRRIRYRLKPYPIALPGGLRIRFEGAVAEAEALRRAAEARTRRRLERFAPPSGRP